MLDVSELRSVRIGRARIGGFLGHFLYNAGEFLRDAGEFLLRVTVSRRTWIALVSVAAVGVASVKGTELGLAWHAQSLRAAMQSPIAKNQFVVEDTHGAGEYLVVRRGAEHLKLECSGGNYEDKDGSHVLGKFDCYEFKPGDVITLERWNQGEFHIVEYVYKMTQGKGEYDYQTFTDSDE